MQLLANLTIFLMATSPVPYVRSGVSSASLSAAQLHAYRAFQTPTTCKITPLVSHALPTAHCAVQVPVANANLAIT